MKIRFSYRVIIFQTILLLGVFNSVIRFYFLETPLSSLVYLPQFLMLLIILKHAIFFVGENKIKRKSLIIIVIVTISFIIGIFYTRTFAQVLMGVYILIPLMYGYLEYNNFQYILNYKRFYAILLSIGVFGVLYNISNIYPWEGFSYVINGHEIEGNRFWTSLGKRRLSGFGRSSFESAAYILFLAIIFFQKRKRLGIVWLLAGVTIFYTNTKGVLLAYLLVSVLIFFRRYTTSFFKKSMLTLLVLFNIILPISSWVISVKRFSRYSFLYSFGDRLQRTWPNAFELMSKSGNLITGRGIGGIGVPQNLFEPKLAHPGDNLFVYLLLIFGVGAVLIYIILLFGIFVKKRRQQEENDLYYLISIFVFTYGVTTNVIELPIVAICLGLVFRYWTENKIDTENVELL